MSWPIQPLQSLCDDFKKDIVDGPFGSNLKREDYQTEGDPVLKIQNIKDFCVVWKKIDYVSPSKFAELKRHSYRKGDIVMTKLGDPLGVSAIVDRDGEGLIVADLVRIRAQNINTRFLCYCLNAPKIKDYINSQSKGATRPRVRITTVRELPIPVPPLAEQERIVGILDEAFEGIAAATAQAEKNLHNARELFQSVLQSTFSQKGDDWVETVLGEACELIKRGIAPKYIDEGGLCVINQKCVRDHTVDFRLSRRHNLSIKKVPEERIVRPGDVLVNSTGVGTLGRVAQIREETNEAATVDTHVTIVRPIKGKFYLDFFGYMMVIIEKEIAASGEGSSGQTELSRKALNENFVVRYPESHTTQQAIVKKLDALSEETKRLEAIYERKQSALAELKQSLLQKAFAGEL